MDYVHLLIFLKVSSRYSKLSLLCIISPDLTVQIKNFSLFLFQKEIFLLILSGVIYKYPSSKAAVAVAMRAN